MTTKEKMLSGEYYISWDEELTQDREEAKDMCFEFNSIRPSLRKEREEVIRKLFEKVGENCCILDCARVTFGNNVWIGPNVGFYTPEHAFISEQRTAGYEHSLPIVVGDNVWICGGVTIVAGVTIGANSIIGAGSVVTKDIPEGVIAVGNPARVLREITEEDRLEMLDK